MEDRSLPRFRGARWDGVKERPERDRERYGFELVEVDITGDPELEAAYREQIPVVFVAGRKAFKYTVDPAELHRRLTSAV